MLNNSSSASKYVLSVDQGTTSTRAILFNKTGSVVSSCQKEHKQYFTGPALVEHDADEIYQRVEECCVGALSFVGATKADVAAIGITNQRETIVCWSRSTGKPYYNALVWQDQRGAALCEKLALDGGADRFRDKTGLPLVPYFSASKLSWLLDNVPGLRDAAEAGEAICGTIDTFLVWRLTAGRVFATDVTNASRTLLFNIHSLSWDAELLSTFRVPMKMLPSVLPSSIRYGVCGSANVDVSKFDQKSQPIACLDGIEVAGILGDQQAALFGQACFSRGDAKNTYGTGCFLLMNVGESPVASVSGLFCTVGYQIEGQPCVYALEGSVSVGGAVISWLKNNLGLISSASESEAIAASVSDTAGAHFVPAFNGLFAPYWKSEARGVISGLSGNTTRAHIVRAALEAVAFQSLELIELMRKEGGGGGESNEGKVGEYPPLRVDGGMTANNLLMQFQADIAGCSVVRPVVSETTALGAAYAAGLAVGFWGGLEELKGQWKIDATWKPTMTQEESKKRVIEWEAAIRKTYAL
jgi:glycerol kinase